MKPFFPAVAATAAVIVTAAAAQVRPPDAAATIRARQANYKQMAAAVKGIGDQLRSRNPSLPAIRQDSAVIVRRAPLLLRWFPRGTGPEADVRTRALPAIWLDHGTFTRRGAALLVAARSLDAAARQGDFERIRAAMPALRGACSGCHDDFRAPE